MMSASVGGGGGSVPTRMLAVVAAAVVTAVAGLTLHAPGREYTHCATLSEAYNVHLAWALRNADDMVDLAFWAPVPDGYVAVGLSDRGDMAGPDGTFGEVWVVRASWGDGAALAGYAPPHAV
jgi:hypothetical protein